MNTYSGTPTDPKPDPYGRRPAEKNVSIPLYVAGAVAQISSLMAVAYQIADPTWAFAIFTILLTLIGMGTSYTLRRMGAPVRLMKMGGLLLAVIFIYALRNGGVFGTIVPAEMLGSQEMLLVSALGFTATFCSFLLVSDESVVFTCVWAIAIIGLTGTVNINRELITSFVVFLLAATFLMVHQNGLSSGIDAFGIRRSLKESGKEVSEDDITAAFQELETRRAKPRAAHRFHSENSRWILLRAQLTMAAAAWLTAIIIGFVVAIPVQMVGRNLSLATIIQRLRVPAAASVIARHAAGKQVLNFDSPRQFQVGLGPVDDDTSEKMIVYSDAPSYWRGRTFDRYNGNGWENSAAPSQGGFGSDPRQAEPLFPKVLTAPSTDRMNTFDIPQKGSKRLKTSRQVNEFHINSGSFSPMYHAGEPIQVRAPASTLFVRDDNTMGTRFVNGMDYEVTSEVSNVSPKELRKSGTDYPRSIRLQYLNPQSAGDSDVLRNLAQEATDGEKNTPYDRAEAIRRFVARRCTYTLEARAVPANEDAAEFFLTESKEGYCDLYATATTVLCRLAGIPARTVTGFAPGTPSEEDPRKYILRGSDQHAWTEVYFQDYGWIPFDATQDTNGTVVTPRTPEPVKKPSLLEKLLAAGLLPTMLMITGIIGVLYVVVSELITRFLPKGGLVRFKRNRKGDAIAQQYAQIARQVGRRAGLPFAETMTPKEFEAEIRQRLGDEFADTLRPLTRTVENASYGPQAAGSQEMAEIRSARRKIQVALRRVSRYTPPQSDKEKSNAPIDAPL